MRRTRPLSARRLPRVCAHDVFSPRIPHALEGIRVGQLSDIHVRTGVYPRRLHAAVEMMNTLAPDLVVLTGDYVCFSPKPLPMLTEALRGLKMPAYAVLGNHDHWSGAERVRQALWDAGVDVLTNESRRVQLREREFHLVGVDDSVTKHHDPARAFADVPAGAPSVCLSHDPKSADLLHRYNPALILSGHTHGGQVFLTRKLTEKLAEKVGVKYLHGFFEIEGSVLYVNRGLGAGVPVRFRAPMEIACLTLRSSATRTREISAAA
jgi:predicted MPP superfamily phosphohydrolase